MAKKRKETKRNRSTSNILAQGKTYLNIIYLLLLFPLGIISFVVVVTLLAISIGLIATPLYAPFTEITIGTMIITALYLKIIISLILCIVGIFALIISLYITNGLTWIFKKILNIFH